MIILCSCSYPHRSGHHVTVNLQQDKCYSVLQLFISIWMKSIIPLKVKPGRQSLENGLSLTFQVIGNILLDKGAEPA